MRAEHILVGLTAFLAVVAVVLAIVAVFLVADDSDADRDAAQEVDRGEFTVDLVRQALRRYDDEGREATVAYYNTPQSLVGEWYVFVFDEDDKLIAHPDPNQIGRDLKGDLGVDVTGYRFGDTMLGAAESGVWVDYLFLNPVTGNQEYKHSWVVRHDGLLIGSGWYQVLPSSAVDVTKADPAEYTVAFVERAVRYYKAHGKQGAIAYYSATESVDGEWYVFIADEDFRLLAHYDTSTLGKHVDDLVPRDVNGKSFSDRDFTESGVWLNYVYDNPETGARGTKHSWVVRYEDVFIGSGWYE